MARKVTQVFVSVEVTSWPEAEPVTTGQFTADAIIGLNIADSGEGSSEVSIIHMFVGVPDSGVGSSVIGISVSGRRGQSTWW